MKKCCPRNTRSTPMKENLRDKAFVAFVCLVGKPLLPKIALCEVDESLVAKTSRDSRDVSTPLDMTCKAKTAFQQSGGRDSSVK
jgi:hypothetical protein